EPARGGVTRRERRPGLAPVRRHATVSPKSRWTLVRHHAETAMKLTLPAVADPAQNGPWVTSLSLINDPPLPLNGHWDYANPDAPKGGLARMFAFGTFDTFNPILPQGQPAVALGLVYETLMTPSLSDSSSQYPLIADAVAYLPAQPQGKVAGRYADHPRRHRLVVPAGGEAQPQLAAILQRRDQGRSQCA